MTTPSERSPSLTAQSSSPRCPHSHPPPPAHPPPPHLLTRSQSVRITEQVGSGDMRGMLATDRGLEDHMHYLTDKHGVAFPQCDSLHSFSIFLFLHLFI